VCGQTIHGLAQVVGAAAQRAARTCHDAC
jgi:hypothetical protein